MKLRSRRSKQRSVGQSLVEFSLALPLFLLVFVGIAEGGYYIIASTMASSATHEGARLAVLASTADRSAVRDRVVEAAGPVVTVAAGDVLLDLTSGGSTTVNCDDTCYQGRKTGDSLKVRTSYSHIPLVGFVFPGVTFAADAEAQLLVEGDGS